MARQGVNRSLAGFRRYVVLSQHRLAEVAHRPAQLIELFVYLPPRFVVLAESRPVWGSLWLR
jgi:hypothetical protein